MKKIKVGIVTQARVGSSRLPGKILKEVGGITLLEMHLDRLKKTGLDVFIATTTESQASKLIEIASKAGLKSKIGSLDDVLSRFYLCAKENELDVVIRVTSDCPLICSDLIRQGVDTFLGYENWENLYLSNTLSRVYPRGMDYEIFSMKALEWAHLNCLDMAYREHVTPYLYLENKCPFIQKVAFKHNGFDTDRSQWRLCVDEESDFNLFVQILNHFDYKQSDYSKLAAFLDQHPGLIKINQEVEQKKI